MTGEGKEDILGRRGLRKKRSEDGGWILRWTQNDKVRREVIREDKEEVWGRRILGKRRSEEEEV